MGWNRMTQSRWASAVTWHIGNARMATICQGCTVGNYEQSSLYCHFAEDTSSSWLGCELQRAAWVSSVLLRQQRSRGSLKHSSSTEHPIVEATIQWFPRVWRTCTASIIGSGSSSLVNHKVDISPEKFLSKIDVIVIQLTNHPLLVHTCLSTEFNEADRVWQPDISWTTILILTRVIINDNRTQVSFFFSTAVRSLALRLHHSLFQQVSTASSILTHP